MCTTRCAAARSRAGTSRIRSPRRPTRFLSFPGHVRGPVPHRLHRPPLGSRAQRTDRRGCRRRRGGHPPADGAEARRAVRGGEAPVDRADAAADPLGRGERRDPARGRRDGPVHGAPARAPRAGRAGARPAARGATAWRRPSGEGRRARASGAPRRPRGLVSQARPCRDRAAARRRLRAGRHVVQAAVHPRPADALGELLVKRRDELQLAAAARAGGGRGLRRGARGGAPRGARPLQALLAPRRPALPALPRARALAAAPRPGAALLRVSGPAYSLRYLTADDAPALFDLGRDPDVTRFFSWGPYREESEAREFIAGLDRRREAGERLELGIVRNGEDRPIGITGLSDFSPRDRRAVVGTWLGREHWGSGANRESKALVMAMGFRALGLNRITALASPQNVRSIAALERLGFVREGVLRGWHVHRGESRDVAVLRMMRDEWEHTPLAEVPVRIEGDVPPALDSSQRK